MADIVRLEENGVPKYIETHIKAVKGIEKVVKKLGINDIAGDKSKINEFDGLFIRSGERVEFFARVKPETPLIEGGVGNTGSFELCNIPVGFRLSNDFDDFVWNVSLSVSKFAKSGTWSADCFAERRATNKIQFFCTNTGNHYVSGAWYTNDEYPS